MKLLYLSCHSILEYDEVKLLHELGHDVFSLGAYIDPRKCVDGMRPPIHGMEPNEELIAKNLDRDNLTYEDVKEFDAMIIMHLPRWLYKYHDIGIPVIWRGIGQGSAELEKRLNELDVHIVRYSPRESKMENYAGEDATIRFYKDPNEYKNWNGLENYVITVAQSMKQRGIFLKYKVFEESTRRLPRKLFGPNNEESGIEGGKLSPQELLNVYRDHRCYFYTGTMPASYTLNFIESWMTGIPIVAMGEKFSMNTYEICDLIDHDENGCIGNSIKDLRNHCQAFLEDWDYAKEIGENGRKKAIKIFGKEVIKEKWRQFLKTIQ